MNRILTAALTLILASSTVLFAGTAVTVSVAPSGKVVRIGDQFTFTATVNGTMNSMAVTWSVNGIAGGNATVGTISANGNYTAPSAAPPAYMVTVKATSVEDPSASGSVTAYVLNPIPTTVSFDPWYVTAGTPFSITVSGNGFMNGAKVLFNGTPLTTSFVSVYLLDAANQPIPTYTQTDVRELSKALTGWTFTNAGGTTGCCGNSSYYPGTMLPMPSRHVNSAKTFLGQTIPAGQTIQQDLEGAIDIIFNHSNVGPFVATRLIRALVTSNPSPAYITAVAQKFNDNGNGVRGDMKAVVREILMNPEARNDNPAANFGRLRTPLQFFVALARTMNWGYGNASGFNYLFVNMNEGILGAPSVFGHYSNYSPLFRIPNTGGLFGPEFQIYSASEAANRTNFLYSKLYVYPSSPAIAPWIAIGGNSTALIAGIDNTLLHGRMSLNLRTAIANSLSAMPDNNQRAINAIYLTALSGEYLVQR